MNNNYQICPSCFYMLEEHTCIEDDSAKPRANDISICFKCATILVFDDALKIQIAPQEVIDSFDSETASQIERA